METMHTLDLYSLSPKWNIDHKRGRLIGKRLKELRELRGLSQKNLAERVGASVENIQTWEKGGNPRDAVMKDELARALQASPSYLCGETDRPNALDSYAPARTMGVWHLIHIIVPKS